MLPPSAPNHARMVMTMNVVTEDTALEMLPLAPQVITLINKQQQAITAALIGMMHTRNAQYHVRAEQILSVLLQ